MKDRDLLTAADVWDLFMLESSVFVICGHGFVMTGLDSTIPVFCNYLSRLFNELQLQNIDNMIIIFGYTPKPIFEFFAGIEKAFWTKCESRNVNIYLGMAIELHYNAM